MGTPGRVQRSDLVNQSTQLWYDRFVTLDWIGLLQCSIAAAQEVT